MGNTPGRQWRKKNCRRMILLVVHRQRKNKFFKLYLQQVELECVKSKEGSRWIIK